MRRRQCPNHRVTEWPIAQDVYTTAEQQIVTACLGALTALHHRHETGRGQVVDSAIYEAVLNMMESLVTEYDKAGFIRERTGAILPNVAPSNVYETRDGMVLIAANQELSRQEASLKQEEIEQGQGSLFGGLGTGDSALGAGNGVGQVKIEGKITGCTIIE